jgi:hypothetical protein
MTDLKGQYSNWEVENLPPSSRYEIRLTQETGGIITVIGQVTLGFRRLINPQPNGPSQYQMCYIVQGIQKKTNRRHLEYLSPDQFLARATIDPGPLKK